MANKNLENIINVLKDLEELSYSEIMKLNIVKTEEYTVSRYKLLYK
jgi:hypothetical protein